VTFKKLRPGNANNRGDALGVMYRGRDLAADDAMEMRLFAANLPPDVAEGPALCADDGSKVLHASKFVARLQKVKMADSGQFAGSLHDSGMPRWRYRDAFDAEYKAFRDRTGWTVDQVAEALGKSVNMLNGYRRDHGSVPPDEVIYKAAELFGCEPTRFMDDPAAATVFGKGYGAMTRGRMDTIQDAMRILSDPRIPDVVAKDLVKELDTRAILVRNLLAGKS